MSFTLLKNRDISRTKSRKPGSGTLVDHAAEELKRSLLDGTYSPGDRLPSVDELAESFGVSRTVIREAMKVLATKGLIEARHGDGTYVRAPRATDLSEALATLVHFGMGDNSTLLVDLMELRMILESAAVRLAALRATTQDLTAISRALSRGKAALKHADREAMVDGDAEFHAAIAQASHNTMLDVILSVIAPLLKDLRMAMMAMRSMPQLSVEGHETVLAAIVSRDPRAAEQAALRHMEHPKAQLHRNLFGLESASAGAEAATGGS